MHKFTKDSFIDFDAYEKHLRYISHIYIDREKLNSAYREIVAYRNAYHDMAVRYMYAMSGTTCSELKQDRIIHYLIQYEKCSSWRFENKKNQSGVSINRKTVLEPLYNQGRARNFLDLYFNYSTYKKLESSVRLLLQKHSFPVEIQGNGGERLNQCNFNVTQQQNYRYNYNKHDIITIPKQYSNSVVAPKGKVLAWGDFSQADLRAAYNIFLRDDENIEVVKQCDDMYEAIARIVAKANKQDFDIKDFKEQRDLMKAVILSCVYGKRTDVEKPKADFLREFGAYLDTKCPKYIEYKKRIQDHIEFRDTVVLDTYFGQPVVVDKGYNPYDDSQMDHKCLNYPIQSCTSLIVIMTVNAILEDFYALGYTEDQIGVYYTRHDEPIFIMDEEVMKDSWIFKDYDKILIDDWYPMGLEFDFGYSYKETEKSLMDKYDESVQLNQTKLHYEEMDPPSGEQFYPLPSIYALAVGTAEAFDGSTVIAIYDKANKQCAYLKQENFDFKVVETYMCSIESRFAKAGYQGVLVRNSFVNKEAYYREMSFKYSKGGALDIAAANALAEYMAAKYAKKNSIDVQLSSHCSTYMDVLREVATVETTLPEFS